jgi:hypothetical protein
MTSNSASHLWILGPLALTIVVIVWSILYPRKRTQGLAAAAKQIPARTRSTEWYALLLACGWSDL